MGQPENCTANGCTGCSECTQNAPESYEMPHKVYLDTLKEVIETNSNLKEDEYNINYEAGSSKGDNYIGVLYRVTVTDKNDVERMKVIIKLPPPNEARREQFFADVCFQRESQFYDLIYPKYKEFQEQNGIVVEEDGFYEVPYCYKSLTEAPFEGIYMQDLKVQGFDMFNRFEKVTKDHVIPVMKALGKFHACSFAIKDQHPEWMEPLKEMKDIFMNYDGNETFKGWFDQLSVQARDALKLSDDQSIIDRCEKAMEENFFTSLLECVDGKISEPYSIICHGDCWNNNIMYHYNKDGKVDDIRLLDWQIMRYSSPVLDLLYYIFGCTTKELRDKYYQEFLDAYYTSLTSFMKRLGSDPAKLFPREIFDEHLIKFGKFGLAMAILVLPVFTCNPEDIPDMDSLSEKFSEAQKKGISIENEVVSFTSSNTVNEYNKRMLGVFQDVCKFQYI